MPHADAVVILTTWPAESDPAEMAEALVRERLAACVNIMSPMDSVYRWKGEVERTTERQVVIKTSRARVPDLQARLASLHPYDVPEWLVLPVVHGAEAYLKWIGESVEGK